MDIQNIVTDQDTELLDSEITQISNDLAETYYFDNDQTEELEMLVAKAMKLGGLYEGKKWQEAKASTVPEGFVLVPKLSASYLYSKVPELGFTHKDEKDTVLYHLNYLAAEFKDEAKQYVEDDHAKQKAVFEADQGD